MRKFIYGMLLVAFLAVPAARAEEEQMGPTTRAVEKEVVKGYLKDEVVGIKPMVGLLAYKDIQGNDTSRLAAGIGLEANIVPMIDSSIKNWYVGPSTGAIYSHLGAPTSNFFGTSPSSNVSGTGANFLVIPANLKVGYQFVHEDIRLSVHGGGNVVYRSEADALNLGESSVGTGSVWKMFPNVGADFEFGLGRYAALMIRPDLTITPGDEFFTGTVALNIPLS